MGADDDPALGGLPENLSEADVVDVLEAWEAAMSR
jgi:hypothetical protein